MMLNIFLQIAVVENFYKLFGITPNDLATSVIFAIVPFIYVIGIGIIAFFVWRVIHIRNQFAGSGTPLQEYEISIFKKYTIKGNLSINRTLERKDYLYELEKNPKTKIVADNVKRLIKEKQIFAYDFRPTDISEAFEIGKAKRLFILASGKIQSDDYSWYDEKSRRSIASIIRKEMTRKAQAHSSSEYIEIRNPDKNIDGYYILNLQLDTEEQIEYGFDQKAVAVPRQKIIINKIEGGRVIAETMSLMAELAESLAINRQNKKRIDNYEIIINEKDEEIFKKQAKIQKRNEELNEKIYVGHETKKKPKEAVSEIVWFIIFWLVGTGTYEIVPKISELQTFPPLLFSVIAMGGVFVLRYMLKKPDKDDDEEDD